MSASMIFFFQAEDGIRDTSVTGVQTCALPIFDEPDLHDHRQQLATRTRPAGIRGRPLERLVNLERSEERRVGKEGRSRWGSWCSKKKMRTVRGDRGGKE